jgi:hypothetical protein
MTKKMVEKSLGKKTPIISETVAAIISTKTKGDAADKIGISETALYKRLDKHPEIKEIINKIPETALNLLKESSLKAAEKIVETIDDKSKGLEAAKDVLDRVGVGKDKGNNTNVQVNILNQIKKDREEYGI